MLTFSPAVRVFVVVAPRDMRGSFDALAGAARHLGLDPTDGHLYLFVTAAQRPHRFGVARAGCCRHGTTAIERRVAT